MQKEPSDELIGTESHDLLFIPIGVIPPAKGDFFVIETENAVIADGDPMGIPTEITKDSFGSAKGRLTIDDPFFVVKPSSEALKGVGLLQMADTAGEDEIPGFEDVFEVAQELPPEQR